MTLTEKLVCLKCIGDIAMGAFMSVIHWKTHQLNKKINKEYTCQK